MLAAGDDCSLDLLQQRAEIASKLRRNLSDPSLRSVLRKQTPNVSNEASTSIAAPPGAPSLGADNTPSSKIALPSESCFLHADDSAVQKAARGVDGKGEGPRVGATKGRSLSAGCLQRPATARPSAGPEAWKSGARPFSLAAALNSKPIPLRGEKHADSSVISDAAVSDAHASLRRLVCPGPPASAAASTCSGGDVDNAELHLHLQATRDRLEQIEIERKRLIDSSIDLLARSASRGPSGIQTPVSPQSSQNGLFSGGLGFGSHAGSAPVPVPLTPTATTPPTIGRQTSPLAGGYSLRHAAAPRSTLPGPEATPTIRQIPLAGFDNRRDSSAACPAGATSPEVLERPEWLLADGRWLTACLEGENRALRRAVARAKVEVDELVKRRSATDDRARSLAEENQAAALALRRIASPAGALPVPPTFPPASTAVVATAPMGPSEPIMPTYANPPTSTGASRGAMKGPGAALKEVPTSARSDAAATSLRKLFLAGSAEDPERSSTTVANPSVTESTPRRQLLERSEEIGRRMEEILSRRGNLQQQVFDSISETTDAGSFATSGGSAASSTTSVPTGTDIHAGTVLGR